jgi:hypothetical protein
MTSWSKKKQCMHCKVTTCIYVKVKVGFSKDGNFMQSILSYLLWIICWFSVRFQLRFHSMRYKSHLYYISGETDMKASEALFKIGYKIILKYLRFLLTFIIWQSLIGLFYIYEEGIHFVFYDWLNVWCLTPLSAISWRPVLVVKEAGENQRPWANDW